MSECTQNASLQHLYFTVTTRLRCDGNVNNTFIINCLQSMPVKELLEGQYLAKIWTKVL